MPMSKKGSLFVESAMIFPLIIVIILLAINYAYRSCDAISEQAQDHMQQRRATMDGDRINRGESQFVREIDFLLEGLK